MKHTATPWRVGFDDGSGFGDDNEGATITSTKTGETITYGGQDSWGLKTGICNTKDAEFIVKAVNSHEELVDLLEGLLEAGSDHWSEGTTTMVKAALARAKGEQTND